jgi:adenylate cyclase
LAAAFIADRVRWQLEQSVRSLGERNRAISLFGQHVSPQVAERLLSQHVDVGPEIREVCVMFLDIRGFTAFSDGRSPGEVMDYLNSLFGFMVEIVNRHNGIINKFLGDGFMAIFGAPVEDGESPRHAVAAAMEIVKQVEEMNVRSGGPPTRIGIGLHAGRAVTGNVGSAHRKEYTVIGDVVNLASRIEQLNKQFDSRVLASEPVYAAMTHNGVKAEPLGPTAIRGSEAKINLFQLA